jgi:hypothetical protein
VPTFTRPSLPELQRWMRWVITFPAGPASVIERPRGEAPLPRNWTRGPEPRRCLPVIGSSPEVSQGTRLSIYGDGYFLRLVGVLAANLASLRNAVGARLFDGGVARDYLVRHPSVHKCIDNIGADMPAFLKTHPATRGLRCLPDLAALEWAFHESFYADDMPPMHAAALAAVPIERWSAARVALDPSVRLLDLRYPVVPLWRQDGKWSRRRLLSMRPRRSPVLVYRRPDGQVRVAAETPGAFALLTALAAGRTFGQALRAGSKAGLSPSRVMPLFREWTTLGVIRRVSFR